MILGEKFEREMGLFLADVESRRLGDQLCADQDRECKGYLDDVGSALDFSCDPLHRETYPLPRAGHIRAAKVHPGYHNCAKDVERVLWSVT